MSGKKRTLSKLLEAMLDEWGEGAIHEALSHILASRDREKVAVVKYSQRIRGMGYVSAVSQVEKLHVPDDRLGILLRIADLFDKKYFLKNSIDLREFIVQMGGRPPLAGNRSEGFKSILEFLLNMPTEHLDNVERMASHSGPAQLGPISDAIAEAGERITRRSNP